LVARVAESSVPRITRPILEHGQEEKTGQSKESSDAPRRASTFCSCIKGEACHRPDGTSDQKYDTNKPQRGIFFHQNNPGDLPNNARKEEKEAEIVVSFDHQRLLTFSDLRLIASSTEIAPKRSLARLT